MGQNQFDAWRNLPPVSSFIFPSPSLPSIPWCTILYCTLRNASCACTSGEGNPRHALGQEKGGKGGGIREENCAAVLLSGGRPTFLEALHPVPPPPLPNGSFSARAGLRAAESREGGRNEKETKFFPCTHEPVWPTCILATSEYRCLSLA